MEQKQHKKKEDFIYGTHPIQEAFDSGKEIDKLLVQKGLHGDAIRDLIHKAKQTETPYQFVPIEKLNRVTRKNHQGIIAFVSQVEYQQLEQVLPMVYENGETPLILLLDRITDIRNIGAIARTAECTGVHAIVVPAQNSARINADAVKSSAGAILRIPIVRSFNLKDSIKYLKDSGLQIFAANEKSTSVYDEVNYTVPAAIIMGSEEDGVSGEYLKLCDETVQIPMVGEIASLNVSVAAGVMLFEVLKQRRSL
ncbi:MAG: 23S rRNA (guanosine(2251)-2'-O)-methyltransferase RlmB [Bacteroidetes bacterium]|nr:MAG: 23S rRNA (guanosine(2251)-2'-O)-methyltransferase RlmB [Bacteroidota bacterium]